MANTISPDLLERLRSAALEAQSRSYSPYSNFPVGAALWTDRDRVVTGCNVENASYGLTRCAEQTAIQRCVVEDAGKPLVAVVVGNTDRPLTPCGSGRQILAEFNPDLRVICFSRTGEFAEFTMRELLPGAFDRDGLEGTEPQ